MDKIKTSKIAAFIYNGTEYVRVRKQSSLTLKYDAETEEEKYVDENAPTTSVERYSVGFEGELVCFKSDPLFEYLDEMRQKRKVGTDAETKCLVVYIYDSDEEGTAYAAEENKCSIQFSEFGGEGGGGSASLNYSVNFNGDPDLGTASVGADGKPEFTKSI